MSLLEIVQHPAAVPQKMPDRLLTLAGEAETFMTPGGDAYAIVEGRTLTWDDFEGWLVRRYREEYGEMASREVVGSVLYNLKMEAREEPRREVYTRVASYDGRLYVDLTDDDGRVVEVDADGWRILDHSPVPFRRAVGMLPLPEPTHGGDVGALRTLLHLASDDDWVLVVAWLLGALHPTGPHPILALHGESNCLGCQGINRPSRPARALASARGFRGARGR